MDQVGLEPATSLLDWSMLRLTNPKSWPYLTFKISNLTKWIQTKKGKHTIQFIEFQWPFSWDILKKDDKENCDILPNSNKFETIFGKLSRIVVFLIFCYNFNTFLCFSANNRSLTTIGHMSIDENHRAKKFCSEF